MERLNSDSTDGNSYGMSSTEQNKKSEYIF